MNKPPAWFLLCSNTAGVTACRPQAVMLNSLLHAPHESGFQWDLKAEKELRTGSLETRIPSCLIYNENNNSLLYYRY